MNGFIVFLLFVYLSGSLYIFFVHRKNFHKGLGIFISPVLSFWGVLILDAIFIHTSWYIFALCLVFILWFCFSQLLFFEEFKKEKKIIVKDAEIKKGNTFNKKLIDYINNETISFLYEDGSGNITYRTVDIYFVDGKYIEGYCHDRKEPRTFKLERILGDINLGDSSFSVDDWLELQPYSIKKFNSQKNQTTPTKRKAVQKNKLEISFTGFKKENKARLEAMAIKNNLVVRTAISKNLDFLVCGDNAGASKKLKAVERGAKCISENDFITMIETGEIPSKN